MLNIYVYNFILINLASTLSTLNMTDESTAVSFPGWNLITNALIKFKMRD